MKKNIIVGLIACLGLQAHSAQALVGCAGPVSSIEVRTDGILVANWGFGTKYICWLNTTGSNAGGPTLTKEACAALYSMFATALANHQQIVSYHQNSTTCNQALTPNDTIGRWAVEQAYGYMVYSG